MYKFIGDDVFQSSSVTSATSAAAAAAVSATSGETMLVELEEVRGPSRGVSVSLTDDTSLLQDDSDSEPSSTNHGKISQHQKLHTCRR